MTQVLKPYMTDPEIAFFDKFFTPEMTVLEWGCGGSTIRWAPRVKNWISIEHDVAWYIQIKSQLPSNCTLALYGLNDERYIKHPAYQGLLRKIDVYIIDGRRRMDCRSFLEEWMRPGSILFVHDAIRYEPSTNFSWYIDVIKGSDIGNHKGIRMYGKFN